MYRTAAIIFSLVALSTANAVAQDRSCKYRDGTCQPQGCIPTDPIQAAKTNPTQIDIDAPGVCGPCRSSVNQQLGNIDCGGSSKCQSGVCILNIAPPAPVPIWPTFHMAVVDVTLATFQGSQVGPIIGAGYMFQGALGRTHPKWVPQEGWVTRDLPHFYFDAGVSLAFASTQNVFGNLGLTYYNPGLPLELTTLSIEGIYQRNGTAIWDSDAYDRIGAGVQAGFLQNLFVRLSYAHTVDAAPHQAAPNVMFISVIYMKELFGDIVPDRFQKYLPKGM